MNRGFEENILDCAINRDLESGRLVVSRGADVNYQDKVDNLTALHWAASTGQKDFVEMLLSQPGIDTTLKDSWGRTASDLARTHAKFEIAEIIEQRPQSPG